MGVISVMRGGWQSLTTLTLALGSVLTLAPIFIVGGGHALPMSSHATEPFPASVFAAGVMVITQESFDKAPQKYPRVVDRLSTAATEVETTPLTPYSVKSSTLVS
jgi:hypothetical protein